MRTVTVEAYRDFLLDSNEFYQGSGKLGYELDTPVRDYGVKHAMELKDIIKKQLGYLLRIDIGGGFDVVSCFRQAVYYYNEGIKPIRYG